MTVELCQARADAYKAKVDDQLTQIYNSRSWRIIQFVRKILNKFKLK